MTVDFFPTTRAEMQQLGWTQCDAILISGDAYVDHPSFGAAVIGRYLEHHGFKVGIIPQPDWKSSDDFKELGAPRLFFGITAGNMDSMIANYTAEKKKRREDAYTEGGMPGKRPDRACIVYTNRIKEIFPKIPIILGGIEASLRRITHYDHWSNACRRSILLDSKADLLIYGMGEKAVVRVAEKLAEGQPLQGIPNTAIVSGQLDRVPDFEIPDHEELLANPKLFMKTMRAHEIEYAKKYPGLVVQKVGKRVLIIEPPDPLSGEELDELYTLPFARAPHPRYKGKIAAFGFVQDSIVSHRGCYGGCTFCTLTLHQGKYIQSRSPESICEEAILISELPEFKGTILDVGGPSANMFQSECTKAEGCRRLSCIVPSICRNLNVDHQNQLTLLRTLKKQPNIKHVFVNSGIRFDLALSSPAYIEAVTKDHTCGQLSLAPEHQENHVLKLMNKPVFSKYQEFEAQFNRANKKHHLQQYIVPYYIAAHPGSTLRDMFNLALYLRQHKQKLKQVQTFIPIPMTLASVMYFTGLDPLTFKPIHIPKGEERLMQRALLQPTLASNFKYVRKALKLLGEESKYSYLIQMKRSKRFSKKV